MQWYHFKNSISRSVRCSDQFKRMLFSYPSNPLHPTLKNRLCEGSPFQQERIDFSLANPYEKKHRPTLPK